MKRRAVIDVGTNSVKLLVAAVDGSHVEPLFEKGRQTRLGRGFYESHQLQSAAIQDTAETVRQYVARARQLEVDDIRIIGTSAARDAANQQELVGAIEQAAGLPIELLSGNQEAEWVFRGVMSDAELAGQPLLIVDVGGGSSELIFGNHEGCQFKKSFSLGTVRLLEALPLKDPPSAEDWQTCRHRINGFTEHKIAPAVNPVLSTPEQPVQLVGTGGTASILARMELQTDEFERPAIEAVRLGLEQLRMHRSYLWGLPLEKRKQVRGLPPKRADVILMGVAIFEGIMESLGFEELRVSTRGLRYAAVMID